MATLEGIGGRVIECTTLEVVKSYITTEFSQQERVVSTLEELSTVAETSWLGDDPHTLENVDLLVMAAEFGVAENGALWVTQEYMGQRAAPFITQNLAVVLKKSDLVPTMHHAYERIGNADYPFGMFLAGPSKTADIEQSLVLGAHGSRTMTVFLLMSE